MNRVGTLAVACLVFVSCGGGGGGSNPGGPTGGTQPPPTLPPSTSTTTTTLPASNQPPVINFTVKPDTGVAPIDVEVNLCQSSDPEGRPLSYRFDCKNGAAAIRDAACRETCRYTQDTRFDPEGCVSDGASERCETKAVKLGPASLPVEIRAAANNACMVEGSADAGGANSFSAMAVTRVTFTLRGPSGSKSIDGRPGSGTQWVMPATQSMGAGSNTLEAEAYNGSKRVGTGKNSRNFTC